MFLFLESFSTIQKERNLTSSKQEQNTISISLTPQVVSLYGLVFQLYPLLVIRFMLCYHFLCVPVWFIAKKYSLKYKHEPVFYWKIQHSGNSHENHIRTRMAYISYSRCPGDIDGGVSRFFMVSVETGSIFLYFYFLVFWLQHPKYLGTFLLLLFNT